MLEVKNLCVSSKEKEIIKDLSFTLKNGEICVIMGPNGSGKSSLCGALMGNPTLKTSGSIRLDGEELISLSSDKRARKGLFLSFQEPEELDGVKVSNLIRKVISAIDGGPQDLDLMLRIHEDVEKAAGDLRMDKSIVSRETERGFLGRREEADGDCCR